MSTNIKLKRSSVAGNIPSTSQLSLGELAINTADGAIYSKKSDNTIFAIHDNTIMALNSADDHVDIYGSLTASPTTASDDITIGSTAQTGTITIGRSTQANTIDIGNGDTGSLQVQTINIGSGVGSATVNLAAKSDSGQTATVNIGNSNASSVSNIAIRGASTFTNGAVAFNGGNFTVNPSAVDNTITLGKTDATGTITLGQSTATNTINIGNGNVANNDNQTVNIASGQGSGMHTVKIAAPSAQGHDTNVTIGGTDQTFGSQTVAIRGNTTFTHGDFGVVPLSFSADDTITLGSTTQTGSITLGQSTKTQTINIGTGAVESGSTKTINIGTANSTGSTTDINIGPTSSTAARNIDINGNVVFANNGTIKRNISGTDVGVSDNVQLAESVGWVPYAGSSVRQYMSWNETEQAVQLVRPATMQSGLLYKAIKVYAGQKVHISFMMKSSGSGPSQGKYIQIYQYDGSSLPSGKTHVGDTGLGNASSFVQNDNTSPVTLVNNGGSSTSWITTTYEYVPANDGFISIGIYFTISFGQITQYVKTPKITNAGLSRMESLAVQYIFG